MNSRLQATVPWNAVLSSDPGEKKNRIALPRMICCLAAYLEAPTRPSSIHVSSTCRLALHTTALTPTAAFWRSAGRRESCEPATAMRCDATGRPGLKNGRGIDVLTWPKIYCFALDAHVRVSSCYLPALVARPWRELEVELDCKQSNQPPRATGSRFLEQSLASLHNGKQISN